MALQCKAHNRQGNRCGRQAIKGGFVCYIHGGAAPSTKMGAERRLEAARQELLELVEPALKRYRQLLGAESEAVSATMIKDLLDRAGLGATAKTSAHVTVERTQDDVDADISTLLEALQSKPAEEAG